MFESVETRSWATKTVRQRISSRRGARKSKAPTTKTVDKQWLETSVRKTSNLIKAHETRDSLSSSCSHIVLVYLQSFRRNSLLKCAPQPKIAKKLLTPTNTPYLSK